MTDQEKDGEWRGIEFIIPFSSVLWSERRRRRRVGRVLGWVPKYLVWGEGITRSAP